MNGIVNVLKPPNLTSHDVVSFMRRVLKTKKIGHTGTLDPMAAGVLPICVGKSTKVIEYMENDNKGYRCQMKLGSSTDTQDRWGNVIFSSTEIPDENSIRNTIESFIGDIDQIPPMYSALKVNGKKLYELARAGVEIERKPRKRKILDIDILSIDYDTILFDVVCSKGTYIRTLCNDIGNMLGCGGHMTFLLRTFSGMFSLKESITMEEILTIDDINSIFISPDVIFKNSPRIFLPESLESKILNGVKIDLEKYLTDSYEKNDIFPIYIKEKFVGIARRKYNGIYLEKLLT